MPARPTLKPLRQQSIVVTGATSRIGLATVHRAAKAGACVFLIDDDAAALRRHVEGLQAEGARAAWAAADVADYDAVQEAADKCQRLFGGFDSWVNVVGISTPEYLDEPSLEDPDWLFDVVCDRLVNGSAVASDHLKRRPGGGTIVNVGASLSDMPSALIEAHAASKSMVKTFTNTLRSQMAEEGVPVRVSLVKPGPIVGAAGPGSRAPQPVYAPQVVADAILWCATHSVHEITVGGAGRLIAMIYAAAPEIAEPLLSRFAPVSVRDGGSDWRTDADGLYEPTEDGFDEEFQYPMVRNFSALAEVRKHPGITAGTLGLILLAATGTVLLTQRTGPRRYEQLRSRINPRGWIDAEALRHRFEDISRGLTERAEELGDRAGDFSDDARHGARKLLRRGQRAVSDKQRRKYAREARRYADDAGRYARAHAREGGALLAVATIAAAIGAAALESRRPDSQIRRIAGV
jgi:NAD(P)-dependent dehydrogenase (short-subunit alcohol dehydrogenase family)/ElaB/YqjD/DUF883 family membrane-anchored ribosome-binding protein